MRSACSILSLAAFLLAASASAEEAYTIKYSSDQVGLRTHRTVVEKETALVTVQDANGKVLKEDDGKKQKDFVCVEKILAKQPGKRASKITQTYEKAVMIDKGEEADLGLKGKTVVIEFKDKTYKFTFEDGAEVAGPALDFLKDEFKGKEDEENKMEEAVLPKKPVKVGESWKCNVDAILKGIGEEVAGAVDPKKVTATGKLVKAYRKNDHQYGVVDVQIELPISHFGKGDQAIKMDAGSVMKLSMTLDAVIDGSEQTGVMTAKMTMKGNGKVSDPNGNEFTIKLDLSMNGTDTRTPVK